MSDELYNTTDFYTTAVLLEGGFEIVEIKREKPNGTEDPKGKVRRFFFQNSPELKEAIMSYMNKKRMGNLRAFRDAIETVKDMVHQG